MKYTCDVIAIAVVVCCTGFIGCSAPGIAYQTSTIDALLDGNYDGEVSFAELKRHGDFGIGTFDALDGEMIAIDGWFYQIRSDGRAHPVSGDMQTPFSVVTFFKPKRSSNLSGPMSYAQLQAQLDAMRPADGHAYAVAIEGWFDRMQTRSVGRQEEPYPRLIEAVQDQKVFDRDGVRGTLVGFWFPQSMRHLNVPGYHFHFLSDGRSIGGHVLDLALRNGTARVMEISTLEIALPATQPSMREASGSDELEQIEKTPSTQPGD